METSLQNDIKRKMRDLEDKWKETQIAFQNIKCEASETIFRYRGAAARKMEEIQYWKEVRFIVNFTLLLPL